MNEEITAVAMRDNVLRQSASLLMYHAKRGESSLIHDGGTEDLMAAIVLDAQTRYTVYLLAAAVTHPFLGGDSVAFRQVSDAKRSLDAIQAVFAGQEERYDNEVVARLFDRTLALAHLRVTAAQGAVTFRTGPRQRLLAVSPMTSR